MSGSQKLESNSMSMDIIGIATGAFSDRICLSSLRAVFKIELRSAIKSALLLMVWGNQILFINGQARPEDVTMALENTTSSIQVKTLEMSQVFNPRL